MADEPQVDTKANSSREASKLSAEEIKESLHDSDDQTTAAQENPAADWRNMRRIIAEDPEWSLATVPELTELCLRHMIANFHNNSEILHKLLPKHQTIVLSRISTSLPLKISAPLLSDEGYWERCCRARWEVNDVASYGGCWKRMFFERHLQGMIELFVPDTTDPAELMETLQLCADVVRKLDIQQLLPPVKSLQPEQLVMDEDSDSESDEEVEKDHIDFTPVLTALPNLEELHITYSVRDCGMNFEWKLFLFKTTDCLKLARCVGACHTLQVFRLHRSKVDCDKVRVLIAHMLNHPMLQTLDLSCNIISDRGARAVGKFLKGHSLLTKLNLMDNNIRGPGAMAIAHALIKNTTLKFLNLRLNHLSDEGGQAICRALMKNQTLTELIISGNELGEPTAAMMAQTLQANNTLKILDISCNRLGLDGGKHLREGLQENGSVTAMDLRLTECGQEAEYRINLMLHRNREAQRNAAVKEREATLPPQNKDPLPQFAHRFQLPPDLVY